MIDQKQTRSLLKKTETRFISVRCVMTLLKLSKQKAISALAYLEDSGFIERSEVSDEYWTISIIGKILISRTFAKEFSEKTLKRSLDELIERAKLVNSSAKYPYAIICLKIISGYPVDGNKNSIHAAYSLKRKKITDSEYEIASDKLRKDYHGSFGNIVELYCYPNTAIRQFLKSKSKVLRLKEYTADEIIKLEGHPVFNAADISMG